MVVGQPSVAAQHQGVYRDNPDAPPPLLLPQLAAKYHPDKVKGSEAEKSAGAEKFKEIGEAYGERQQGGSERGQGGLHRTKASAARSKSMGTHHHDTTQPHTPLRRTGAIKTAGPATNTHPRAHTCSPARTQMCCQIPRNARCTTNSARRG